MLRKSSYKFATFFSNRFNKVIRKFQRRYPVKTKTLDLQNIGELFQICLTFMVSEKYTTKVCQICDYDSNTTVIFEFWLVKSGF